MRVLVLALAALAGSSAATPAAVKPVRTAARRYFQAIIRGDADAALGVVAEPSDGDRLVVRATAATESELGRLEEAAISRFGEKGDLGIGARHRRQLAAIGRAPVELNGDQAVLRPEGARPVRLRQVNGSWKVESPADRLTGEERKAMEEALRKTVAAAKDLAERIRSGAVKEAEEARQSLRRALGSGGEKGTWL